MTPTQIIDKFLEEIREADTKIAPAPWCENVCYNWIMHIVRNVEIDCASDDHKPEDCPGAYNKYDGPYIYKMRTSLPKAAEALRVAVEALKAYQEEAGCVTGIKALEQIAKIIKEGE